MNLILFFFNLRTIYFKQTLAQICYFYGWVILGISSTFLLGNSYDMPIIIYPLVVFAVNYALFRSILRAILVNNLLNCYSDSVLSVPPAEIANSSINLELDGIDSLKPVAIYKNARFFVATFNFYTRTKYGDFLAKQAFYNVLEVQLNRHLPHILFDNKKVKRNQFSYMYLDSQKISIQGAFDDVYDTYVPQTYNIDSLSFITPEVMESLLLVSNCDVEIINDKLLLYAPLLSKESLEVIATQGRDLADHLNDNIDTYRDSRLEYKKSKTNVTMFGRTLLKSPRKYLYRAVLSGILTVGIIVGSFIIEPDLRDDLLFNQLSFLIYIILIESSWKAYSIIKVNNKALESYRILYHTDRGKPM